MYMWHEGVANRDASEVGSCILDYCKNSSRKGIRKLVAYSDACGGQNHNVKVALKWLHIVSTLDIDQVDHKL